MPFNKKFREKQREQKAKNKANKSKSGKSSMPTSSDPKFPEQDIHCKGMTFHGKGKLDKYGNYTRA